MLPTAELYKCKCWRGQPKASNKNGIVEITVFVGMGPRQTLEALGKKLNALNTFYDHSESPCYAKLSVQGDIHCAPQRLSSRGCSRGGVQGYSYNRNVQNINTCVRSLEVNQHVCTCGRNDVMSRAQTLLWLKTC